MAWNIDVGIFVGVAVNIDWKVKFQLCFSKFLKSTNAYFFFPILKYGIVR